MIRSIRRGVFSSYSPHHTHHKPHREHKPSPKPSPEHSIMLFAIPLLRHANLIRPLTSLHRVHPFVQFPSPTSRLQQEKYAAPLLPPAPKPKHQAHEWQSKETAPVSVNSLVPQSDGFPDLLGCLGKGLEGLRTAGEHEVGRKLPGNVMRRRDHA